MRKFLSLQQEEKEVKENFDKLLVALINNNNSNDVNVYCNSRHLKRDTTSYPLIESIRVELIHFSSGVSTYPPL